MREFTFTTFNNKEVAVPDGYWILEINSFKWHTYAEDEHSDDRQGGTCVQIVGANEKDVELHFRSISSSSSAGGHLTHATRSYVSPEPFGVVAHDTCESGDDPGRYFHVARRVENGKPGPKPTLAHKPRFARSEGRYGGHDHGLRGSDGWCRLSDLLSHVQVEYPDMHVQEMLERFFLFTDLNDPNWQVLVDADWDDIHGKPSKCPPHRTHRQMLLALQKSSDIQRIWVRQGFAVTVLHLVSLGHLPERFNASTHSSARAAFCEPRANMETWPERDEETNAERRAYEPEDQEMEAAWEADALTAAQNPDDVDDMDNYVLTGVPIKLGMKGRMGRLFRGRRPKNHYKGDRDHKGYRDRGPRRRFWEAVPHTVPIKAVALQRLIQLQ